MNKACSLKSCLLIALLLASLAGCGKSTSKKAALEGRWIGFEPARPEARCVLIITGSQFDYRGALSNDWCRGTFVLNEQAEPRQLDLTLQEIAAPGYVGKVSLAIYELQADELKVAAAEPGTPSRPASLAGGPGVRVFSFKRE